MRAGDGPNIRSARTDSVKMLVGRDISIAADECAIHAEVAQLIFIGQENDLGFVPYAMLPQFEFQVHHILERCSLARTHAVAGSDHKAAAFSLFHSIDQREERFGRFYSVIRRADRYGVFARPQPFRSSKVQFGTSRIDQIVIGNRFAFLVCPERFSSTTTYGLAMSALPSG